MQPAEPLQRLALLLVCAMAVATKPTSDLSRRAGPGNVTSAQDKCLQLSNIEHRENTAGLFCAHMWDGQLCWARTPAGTSVTQDCLAHPDLDKNEKVTKYCDDRGQWVGTGSTCSTASDKPLKSVSELLADVAEEPSTEPTVDSDVERLLKKLVLENRLKCFQKMKQDPPSNRAGPYCSRDWDGYLCWDDAAAGTFASQRCPDYYFDLDPTEKATRFCDEDGQWFHLPNSNTTWANYTLCAVHPKDRLRTEATLSGDIDLGSAEATVSPMVNPEEEEVVRKKILDSQYKCFEKMTRDPPYNRSGPYCSRNWDGWLCWDDAPTGTLTTQNCPNYFVDFDPTEKATKYCGEDGQWFRHPDTNRTWSNYTRCNENTKAKLKSAYILFYMAIVGHALSIASLLISLAIFFYFRTLRKVSSSCRGEL